MPWVTLIVTLIPGILREWNLFYFILFLNTISQWCHSDVTWSAHSTSAHTDNIFLL